VHAHAVVGIAACALFAAITAVAIIGANVEIECEPARITCSQSPDYGARITYNVKQDFSITGCVERAAARATERGRSPCKIEIQKRNATRNSACNPPSRIRSRTTQSARAEE
jgi:hypothetical protein